MVPRLRRSIRQEPPGLRHPARFPAPRTSGDPGFTTKNQHGTQGPKITAHPVAYRLRPVSPTNPSAQCPNSPDDITSTVRGTRPRRILPAPRATGRDGHFTEHSCGVRRQSEAATPLWMRSGAGYAPAKCRDSGFQSKAPPEAAHSKAEAALPRNLAGGTPGYRYLARRTQCLARATGKGWPWYTGGQGCPRYARMPVPQASSPVTTPACRPSRPFCDEETERQPPEAEGLMHPRAQGKRA